MISDINLQQFIKTHVTGRQDSLLQADLEKYDTELRQRIDGRNVLVIGGAGSIGSAYIKAILKFGIAKLVVVDIDENGLTELVRDLRSSVDNQHPGGIHHLSGQLWRQVFEKLFLSPWPLPHCGQLCCP